MQPVVMGGREMEEGESIGGGEASLAAEIRRQRSMGGKPRGSPEFRGLGVRGLGVRG